MPFNFKFTLHTRQKSEASCAFGLLSRFCTGFVGVFSLIHANLLNLLGVFLTLMNAMRIPAGNLLVQ